MKLINLISSHSQPTFESAYYALRHKIFMHFIQRDAPLNESDLMLEDMLALIEEIAFDYQRLRQEKLRREEKWAI